MIKIAIYLSLLYVVCADPTPTTTERPKQFRYVEVEEEPQHIASAQKQTDAHHYGAPKYSEAHHSQQLEPNKPEIIYQYGVDDKNTEQRRPLVSVNRDNTGLGRNVDVGVNVGGLYQMDLKQENNFGSKALNLGLSVLNGLVKVNVQRERDPFSGRRGPILVQVGGHTVYSNGYN